MTNFPNRNCATARPCRPSPAGPARGSAAIRICPSWQVAIDTESTMFCDGQNFYLTRKLRATEGADETEVLTKEWAETLPRGLL